MDVLESLGVSCEEVSLPSFEYGLSAYYLIAPAEASSNLARFDGVRYGYRAEGEFDNIWDMYDATRAEGFGPEVKRRIMLGTYALSAGYYDAYYAQAQKVRTLIVRDYGRAFDDYDLLVSPTSPTTAFKLGEKMDDPLTMYLSDICTIPVNLAGIPALSLPCGLADGLPVGFQIMGPPLSEQKILDVAFALEREIGFDPRPTGLAARDSESASPTTPGGEMDHETIIGLEIHAELNTKSKMFCGCEATFGGDPNTKACPVCLGHPGSLPVMNREAVSNTILLALALNCGITERSIFHRKNYFYPDMPKNFQISQYDVPLSHDGSIDVEMEGYTRTVGITRVHLEEDTGKSIHIGESGRIHGAEHSMEDFNRAGIPLAEIVTEPDMRSPAEARTFMQLLRATLEYLGISDCKMEEGSLRCDANISVAVDGVMGTKSR